MHKKYYDRSDFIFTKKLDGPKQYFRDSCCRHFLCCKRCKKDRRSRSFELARLQLSREVNIVDIVKTQRFFKAAFKYLLPAQVMKKLKEHGRYIVIDPEKMEYEKLDSKVKEDSMYSISVISSSELDESFHSEALNL